MLHGDHLCIPFRAAWVKTQGYQYSPDDIITLRIEGEMPVFARIVEVYLYEAHKLLFLVEELTTILFNHHYHAFQVSA